MIEVRNINKAFADNHVLKDVSAQFVDSKINLIIGQSGSGKTVLLKSLVGLFDVDAGEIIFDGMIFNKIHRREQKKIRKNIGMLFQGSALFDFLDVEKNVMFPLDMFTDLSHQEKKEQVNKCLARVNLGNVNHLLPSEISGGMQKRVGIARAIVMNPKYLFCDEPTSGLDPRTAVIIDELIYEITQEFGMTTIINTHDMNSVTNIGEKVFFIYEGMKWWEGDKTQIFKSDNAELNDFIFASSLATEAKRG